MTRIAIVGMACRYPDAASPRELWDNAVAGRRAFRRLPDTRMRLEDYWDPDPAAPDTFYARTAAVIEGYTFDRMAHRIAGSTYRSTDLTHWLALDMAGRALADAGFPEGSGLPRARTGVVVGNTLTGEFTRANVMRLRWPYVRRTLAAALKEQGWDDDRLATFLAGYEEVYKDPFPPVDEDTLAGGLANTIAGRICNHYDLHGGGYIVDGACSSSLLSVVTSAKALTDGELDVAIAGGVDLSIDPFEVIGFAKTGALAKGEFRLYDRHSNGFWPGEGCGIVVLMREADALAAGHRVYATVAGWGISSDGKGGMTRPEVKGYRLALERAYERAGFGIETVSLFEGHGTGTAIGDATELTALSQSRAAADPAAPPAAVGSIKGMIGHAKAAAGVAGLIKAAMAVHEQVLPPTIGCVDPHPVLAEEPAALRVLRQAEPWPDGRPLRAGVTAMGFGGINTHVVLEAEAPRRRMSSRTRALATAQQDAELFLFDAASWEELRGGVAEVAAFVPAVSYAQLGDLAGTLRGRLRGLPYRAAAVVASPEDAERQLGRVLTALDSGQSELFTPDGKAWLRRASARPRVGFLFPGQGSGRGTSGGALRRRLPCVDELYRTAGLPTTGDMVATSVAQPRITTGSMAGVRALSALGIEAEVAVGHSLGELSALCWAGAMDEAALLRVAGKRGRAMEQHSDSGTMAGLRAGPEAARRLIGDLPVVIAGYNSGDQTVVAGPVDAIDQVGQAAAREGLTWTRLNVSHAFHSPLVAPAAQALGDALAGERFVPPARRVVSTVTGAELNGDTDVTELLLRQITAPVRFAQAVRLAADGLDLLVEVGPGRVLSGLAEELTDVPAVALETDGESLTGLLGVVAAAHVSGVPVEHEELFHGRLVHPLEIGTEFSFFASPAESAPKPFVKAVAKPVTVPGQAAAQESAKRDGESTTDLLRRLAAERVELPLELVTADSKPLDGLHLSSVTVMHILDQATQHLGMPAVQLPNVATATLGELGEALDRLAAQPRDQRARGVAAAATWVRPFTVDLDELPVPRRVAKEQQGRWEVFAPSGSALAQPLKQALEQEKVGSGVLVCLPPDCAAADLEQALLGAQAALAAGPGTRFVLVQHGKGAAGLAKTLHLEAPGVRTTVVHVPPATELIGQVVAEVAATGDFSEVHLGADGVRRVPTLRVLPAGQEREEHPLTADDVLLVTGGGKGITAECAIAMAGAVAGAGSAKLLLLGRSDPAQDEELAANLRRMTGSGLTVHYARADAADPDQVRQAVAAGEQALGPVTAILHGAGYNAPAGIASLTPDAFARTFAPKVDGLRNVLAAVDPGRLRLLVTLGSIIGRAGLQGEAHYATANEWLAELTTEVGAAHPDTRCLCLEWSVWSEVGMGERLSVVDKLTEQGITPIPVEQGVRIMRRLVTDPDLDGVVVISGRTEGVATVRRDEPELPLLRFVGTPLIRYHGVELVSEVELNAGTDLYLADHLLDGNLLFPAVIGMEAMSQVACAATGRQEAPVIERAAFSRPIIVPPGSSTTLRIAAAATGDDTVAVTIRSAETGFEVDHFSAELRFDAGPCPEGPPGQIPDGLPPVALDPDTDLYGQVLFQGTRFQRLRRYHRAAARHVDADLAVERDGSWFAGYLPGELLLGDPGMRDALMHGNQVCVPDATLLPTGIDRVRPGGAALDELDEVRYCAAERSRDGDTYVYDIAVRTKTGDLVERWEGLRLQAVRKQDGRGPWAAPLLGPYVERRLGDLVGASVAVVVEPGDELTDLARQRLHTLPAAPPPQGSSALAHVPGLTLTVAATQTVACAITPVGAAPEPAHRATAERNDTQAGLAERIAAQAGESGDVAAARVRAAAACLRDAGLGDLAEPELRPPTGDGWVVLATADARIATLATTVRGLTDPVVVAVLTEGRS
ncbi:type I polyketide synthase [Nonomuraea gerenzanensis]|uniref:Malonyl CoA-acyl carrier protein transacylase n=1 Tax=Nonomuraea gerenzanensis TaxID=93944 RepID=A0A1M4EAA4_9ACTN|nr:type I polyketide synthase [Nonomuraea gerenzanensis]UBU18052.1 type I polyketide synthase [Nonomuraea gerenzanensis]SBO95857.1 Malonyl CoA-acyl carrier protein transacylase [Nonomuraea gerenzanensis]